jgi:hypothetical protein
VLAHRRGEYARAVDLMKPIAALIEACGEGFGALGRESDCGLACEYVSERGEWSNAHEGETPENAVARLWLSLHQAAANGTA